MKPSTRMGYAIAFLAGRFWFGSVSASENTARLYHYDPDGSLNVMETGLTISNGLGWSPDNQTFYLTDSAAQSTPMILTWNVEN